MARYIIDVRTRQEYAARHLEGAINIDFNGGSFDTEIRCFPRDGEYVVYCNAGGRAGRATTRMKVLGFADVTSYGIMGAAVATGAVVTYQSVPG